MFDVIIIGAGPAGLSAGLYSARAKMSTLLIEKLVDGGQIVGTADIENYPGAPANSGGISLIERMTEQVKEFGVERLYADVISVDLDANPKKVVTTDGEFEAKTVIIATGAKPRKIGCEGEDKFSGRGISFCATCDGPFSEGLHSYVIGGGDAAVEEAMFLTKFAKKVTIIHRRDELKAAKSIQEKAFKNEKIDFMWNTEVIEIKGDKLISSFVTRNTETGEIKEVFPDEGDMTLSIFVFIGYLPNTDIFAEQLTLERGYIKTNENMETEIPGVYAAGDVRVKSLRQVVTATADGAIASVTAEKYIDNL